MKEKDFMLLCKYCAFYDLRYGSCDHPKINANGEEAWLDMKPEDYCSYGKEKDERKLMIEILYNFYCDTNNHICDGCGIRSAEAACAEIVDHLIANGVTIMRGQIR